MSKNLSRCGRAAGHTKGTPTTKMELSPNSPPASLSAAMATHPHLFTNDTSAATAMQRGLSNNSTRAGYGLKAVLLVGGPSVGTRFRPLSLTLPKPLFPIAGVPMVYHHVAALAKVEGMREILLIGFYGTQKDED